MLNNSNTDKMFLCKPKVLFCTRSTPERYPTRVKTPGTFFEKVSQFKQNPHTKLCYSGANCRRSSIAVCDPRVNKRPIVPDCCPPKMADIMKKCWSQDPCFRPQAKDLDTLFMDMNMQEAEPIIKEQSGPGHIRKERATGGKISLPPCHTEAISSHVFILFPQI